MIAFEHKLISLGRYPLLPDRVDTLQVNMGKRCNQSCKHCHVEAGPHRTETMSGTVLDSVLRVLKRYDITTVDITGGAPELNPHFETFVASASNLQKRVLVRSNLTVHLEEGLEHLPEFLRKHRVEIIASLPCYLRENIDAQRGSGVSEKSLKVLRRLNQLGYGRPESGLVLNLVNNPTGPSLPPIQETLETEYRRELSHRYGIVFNRLFTLTNVPIGRFRRALTAAGKLDQYMEILGKAFNPYVVNSLMCRNLLSVGWDGTLYDCDFNQMLGLPLDPEAPSTIHEFDPEALTKRKIGIGEHCFACTAGAGSSCGGVLC